MRHDLVELGAHPAVDAFLRRQREQERFAITKISNFLFALFPWTRAESAKNLFCSKWVWIFLKVGFHLKKNSFNTNFVHFILKCSYKENAQLKLVKHIEQRGYAGAMLLRGE